MRSWGSPTSTEIVYQQNRMNEVHLVQARQAISYKTTPYRSNENAEQVAHTEEGGKRRREERSA